MSIIRASRWLRSCLLAIFVVAQLAGIAPLVYGHTLNALEDCAVAGHEHRHAHAHVCGSLASGDSDHHHGAGGALHDQCCALHVLAGPIPQMAETAPVDILRARLAPSGAARLTDRGPPGLDRPPRPASLI
jgi:ABC-type Zn2+ transport system substrate-binding protein/surface adhesin